MGGKGGSSKAPAPDKNIGRAALKQAELGKNWLKFAEKQFDIGNERQIGIDELENQIRTQQIATQDQANTWSREDRDRYKTVFQPMEDKYISDANSWDSSSRQDKMATEARADVLGASAMQRQASNRQMAAMGVNPNSGRFAGVNRAGDTGTALAAAGAQNNARNTVRQQGMAMRADAVNMGKGLPSQAAGAAGLGLSAGNSAMGNATSANNSWRSNVGIMGQGFGGAMQGYAGQANALNSQYGNQLQGWAVQNQASSANSSGLMSGIGSIAGMAMSYFSSKELKTDKQPVDGALEAVKSMPVEEWKYKDGVEDGGKHIGPYAEDFHEATGKGDGTSIPVQDAIGVTMRAIQELDKKVEVIGRSINPPKKRAKA